MSNSGHQNFYTHNSHTHHTASHHYNNHSRPPPLEYASNRDKHNNTQLRYQHHSPYQPKSYNYVRSVSQSNTTGATQQRPHSPTSPRHPRSIQSGTITTRTSPQRTPTIIQNNAQHNNNHTSIATNDIRHTNNNTQTNVGSTAVPSQPTVPSTQSMPSLPAAPKSITKRTYSTQRKKRSNVSTAIRDKLKQAYTDLTKYMPFELSYRMSAEITETHQLYPHLALEPHEFRILLVNFNLSQLTGGLRKETGLQLVIEWKSSDKQTTYRRVAQSNISQLITFMKRVKEFEFDLNTIKPNTTNTNKPILLSEISGFKTTGTSGAFERLLYMCRRTKTFQQISDIFPRPRTHSTADIPTVLQKTEPLKVENYDTILKQLGIIDHVVIDDAESSDSDNDPQIENTVTDAAVTRSNSQQHLIHEGNADVLLCWWYTDKPNTLIKSNIQQLINTCMDKFQYKSTVKSERTQSTVSEWFVDDTQIESVLNALSITVIQALKATQLSGDIKTQQQALHKIIRDIQTSKDNSTAVPLRIGNAVNMVVVSKSYFQQCTQTLSSSLISEQCYISVLPTTSKLLITHNNTIPFTPSITPQQLQRIVQTEHNVVAKYIKTLLHDQNFYLETIPHYTDDNTQYSHIFVDEHIVPTSIWQRTIDTELNIHTVIEWPYNIDTMKQIKEIPFNVNMILYWLQFYIKVIKSVKCIFVVPARLWPAATSRQAVIDCIATNIQSHANATDTDTDTTKRRKTIKQANILYSGFKCNTITIGQIAITTQNELNTTQINSDTTIIDAHMHNVGRQVFIVVELNVTP